MTVLVSACAAHGAAITADPPISGPATEMVRPAPEADATRTLPGSLAADFAALQAQLPGRMGLALMAVGSDHVITLGDWTTGVAWSTIKVPLALAALRRDPVGLADLAESAITTSDNDAAQALWIALGGGEPAAEAVEAVLREAGDTHTDVADRHNPDARQSIDDPMVFGATQWSLVDQLRFAARLPCLRNASRVVDLMQQITDSQSWGLGSFVGAEYKGGWGPDDDTGAYLVRQFGLIPTWSGQLAVALAAQPDSGSYDDAVTMLDRMSELLAAHVHELRGGECTR
ncbi:serine hydrolase [Nocardia veterana]|nr:serine hydrolase [Nocardia veterana]